MVKTKDMLVLYVILCIIGTALEWAYGALWDLCGQSPWIYTDSAMRYTSFESLPLWGLGGLICIIIYRTYLDRNWRTAAGVIPLLALAAVWVIIHGLVIQ